MNRDMERKRLREKVRELQAKIESLQAELATRPRPEQRMSSAALAARSRRWRREVNRERSTRTD